MSDSYCEGCEKQWPIWTAPRTSVAGDGGYVLIQQNGAPYHAVPDSDEVSPCTKERIG